MPARQAVGCWAAMSDLQSSAGAVERSSRNQMGREICRMKVMIIVLPWGGVEWISSDSVIGPWHLPTSPLLYKPRDAVPLVAMTGPPNNDIACVADRKEEEELPGADLFWLSYQDDAETCQGYVLGTGSNMPRIDVCEINAKLGRISPDFRNLD
ncbi:hypothetical protein BU17DRAFT_64235 [Hysterangium stoloniferum]|nr:hypothetical protein BU17DRAFT_64235 [Hysterangium stoloniferum]